MLGFGSQPFGDADAGAHVQRDVVAGKIERRSKDVEDPLRHCLGAGCQRGSLGQDDELIASEASDRVTFAKRASQADTDSGQQLIADGMAQGVVDVLEVVEVEEEQGHRGMVSSGAGQHLVDAVENQGAVGKTGERVMKRLMLELIGAFVHHRQGPRAAGAQHVDQRPQQQAENETAQQQGEGIRVGQHATPVDGAVRLYVPSVVEFDGRRLGARWRRTVLEGHPGGAGAILERHRGFRMVRHRGGQEHLRNDQGAGPSDECGATGLHRARHDGV